MPKLMFAWLGSGRTRRRPVAASARNLDLAARSGLPVPPGAVLLDEFFQIVRANDLVAATGSRLYVTDPQALWATLFASVRLPRFDRAIAVRVAHDMDSSTLARCGLEPEIDAEDPQQLARALAEAWSQAGHGESLKRRDVLLLETVAFETCGTATSAASGARDMIEIWSQPGTANGSEEPLRETYELARLDGLRRPDEQLAPYAQRLQMLLRGVRRSLGRGNWVVSWVDDGHICWLTDVRDAASAV